MKRTLIFITILLIVFILTSCDNSTKTNKIANETTTPVSGLTSTGDTETLTPIITDTETLTPIITDTLTPSSTETTVTDFQGRELIDDWYYLDIQGRAPYIEENVDIYELTYGMTYLEIKDKLGPGLYRNKYFSSVHELLYFDWKPDDSTRIRLSFAPTPMEGDTSENSNYNWISRPNCKYLELRKIVVYRNYEDYGNRETIARMTENGWEYLDPSYS